MVAQILNSFPIVGGLDNLSIMEEGGESAVVVNLVLANELGCHIVDVHVQRRLDRVKVAGVGAVLRRKDERR